MTRYRGTDKGIEVMPKVVPSTYRSLGLCHMDSDERLSLVLTELLVEWRNLRGDRT